MAKPAPSRVAAALDYLERLKSQAAEFGGGVVENLADRARSVGGLAYEALATDPNMGRMTTAEFSEAADRPTPRLDQAARDIGTIGRAIVTQPIQTGKAIVQGEVERAREAMSSPRAAGQYAGSFIDPVRIAAALRKTAPVLELDVYHGTPHRFEPTEANPLGEFDASKMGAGQGAQIHGQGIYLTENPKEAAQHRKIKGLQKNNEPADEFKVADAAAYAAKEKTGASLYHAELASHNILDWVRRGNKAEDFLRHNEVPESLRPVYEAALPYYAGYFKNKGSLYKADLPDEMIARMIDAEKPINQQSAEVRKALEEAGIDTKSSMLGSQISQKDLQKSGIAGLFYTNNRPGGPRNFVVFPGEEKKVRILERDGQKAPPQKIAQALEAAPTAARRPTALPTIEPGDVVDGYKVRPDIPNQSSIAASLDNYEVLPGIRSINMTEFDPQYVRSISPDKLDLRTRKLMDEISQSKELNPLIVAYDSKGPYIIEGGHRFDALAASKAKSVPAMVVIDMDDPPK